MHDREGERGKVPKIREGGQSRGIEKECQSAVSLFGCTIGLATRNDTRNGFGSLGPRLRSKHRDERGRKQAQSGGRSQEGGRAANAEWETLAVRVNPRHNYC